MIMKIDVTDNNFDKEVINKSREIPVIVDFWASWCGPCLMLAPVLNKALDSDEFRNKAVLAKADTADCPIKSAIYGIDAIPNVQLFKNGEVVSKSIGFKPLELITQWLRNNL